MANGRIILSDSHPKVVGSFGSMQDLHRWPLQQVRDACDLVEIRLDLLPEELVVPSAWDHLKALPLLFTSRRYEEGGALRLDPVARMNLLRKSLGQASLVDVEVASIAEMSDLLAELVELEIPWIASHHDFEKLPSPAVLREAASRARDAGAAVFKVAAKLASPADLGALAEFQLADHGIPVATMGMGPLAPVSRLLCAQCGSLLNYGYLGDTPTAPGQWDSALLKLAISRLAPINA